MTPSRPTVSAIVVVRNEVQHVGRCVESLLAQDYDRLVELILVDGMSSDGTRAILDEFAVKHPSRVRVLDNPKRTLAAGWNLAIKAARGEVVIRLDAHAVAAPSFVRKSVELLRRHPEAWCAGGVLETIGVTPIGEVVAELLKSPFGVGNSLFRIKSDWEGFVDTVPYGAYWRWVFDRVGLFDEELVRNEDLDLHARIRKAGGKFYLSSEVRTVYLARSTLSGLFKKAFGDGFWTMKAWRKNRQSLRLRHLLPLAFTAGVLFGPLVSFALPAVWYVYGAAIGLYLALAVLFAVHAAWKTRKARMMLLAGLFVAFHFVRGLGCLAYFIRSAFARSASPPAGRSRDEAHGIVQKLQ